MYLTALPDSVRRTEAIESSGIKPFVDEIVFRPTKYSWDMTRDMYNKITLMDALYSFWREMGDGSNIEPLRELMDATSYVEDPDFHSRWRNHEIRKFGFADFAQKYMDSTTPIPESEIETAFENYMEIAHELRGMFESGQVHRAWTNALRQLPSVHTFEIGKWNVKKNHKHDWKNHKESDCLPVQH